MRDKLSKAWDQPKPRRAAALSVHLFTATGAVLAFLALLSATAYDWPKMFMWLGIALFVDGIDGTFARAVDVKTYEQRYSGEVLDLVIDFLTYVFVPTYALVAAGLLPSSLSLWCAAAILLSSAFYFADGNMKTAESGFRGFPAIWNVAIFVLFALKPNVWLSAVIVALLVVLTFAPIVFVHPVRVKRFRPLTLSIVLIWAFAGGWAISTGFNAPDWVKYLLSLSSAYFLILPLFFGKAKPYAE